jgi:hypothetical protein
MKKALITILIGLSTLSLSKAGTFSIYSDSVTLTGITGTISALWGTFSGGTFTPLLTSTPTPGLNTGYFDGSGPVLDVTLSQNNNNTISVGTSLFLNIYNSPSGSAYSSSVNQIVLSDPSWTAPTFGVSSSTSPEFTANTVVNNLTGFTGGSYSFNSGSPEIGLQVVPEPSSYALMALGGLVLFFMIRRRKVQA